MQLLEFYVLCKIPENKTKQLHFCKLLLSEKKVLNKNSSKCKNYTVQRSFMASPTNYFKPNNNKLE